MSLLFIIAILSGCYVSIRVLVVNDKSKDIYIKRILKMLFVESIRKLVVKTLKSIRKLVVGIRKLVVREKKKRCSPVLVRITED